MSDPYVIQDNILFTELRDVGSVSCVVFREVHDGAFVLLPHRERLVLTMRAFCSKDLNHAASSGSRQSLRVVEDPSRLQAKISLSDLVVIRTVRFTLPALGLDLCAPVHVLVSQNLTWNCSRRSLGSDCLRGPGLQSPLMSSLSNFSLRLTQYSRRG